MSTKVALTLPSSIQPKPSRTDLIEAMVKRAEILQAKELSAWSAKMKELREAYETEARQVLLSGKFELRRIADPDEDGATISVKCQNSKLRKIAKTWEAAHSEKPVRFNEKEIRQDIIQRLKGHTGGAAAILSNEESVRQIDQFLSGNNAA